MLHCILIDLRKTGFVAMDPMLTGILKQFEFESKDELETAYGVEIHMEALTLARDITIRHSNVLLANEEGSSDNFKALLHKKALELLENACLRLRHDLDADAEENALNNDEYLLCRALVELEEIKKEKDHGKRLWIPRVQKEYQDLMDKWDRFMRKLKPIVMSSTRCKRTFEELHTLEQVREGLVSLIHEAEADKDEMKRTTGMATCLSSLITELLATHKNLKENFAVSPRLVAEVASPLTGFPASWLLCCSKPPLQGLESRLSERLIEQKHVSFLISKALSRKKSRPQPLGSFLFLYGCGEGRTEHAKALAKQLFDDEELLTEFDMSDYRESDSASRLIGAPSSCEACGAVGLLAEAVKKKPFGVILLDNVDMAHSAVIDFLIEILSYGRVLDGQGNIVYFTNTLIVMTSNVIDDKFSQWGCKCLWRSQDGPMKDRFYHDPREQLHQCTYFSLLTEARKYFRPELFDKLDEVIVFHILSPEMFMSVGRLQLRDIASSITGRLILYPSEAALRCLVMRESVWPHGGKALKILLEENVSPVLFDFLEQNKNDDMCAVYIDSLVGTNELSCRFEKRGNYLEDLFLKHFKVSLKELRTMYCKEKERIHKIYLLRRGFFTLINLLNAKTKTLVDFGRVADTVHKLLDAVDDLIRNSVDIHNECRPAETSFISIEETEQERPSKPPVIQVQGLLCSRVVGQNQAVNIVAEALMKSIFSPHDLPHRPTASLLFLGLNDVGQYNLVRSLAEKFVCDDGTDLFVYVDLSKYRDTDSLFRLIYEPLELSNEHSQHGFSLLELVQTRPHSILVFSQVEKAHISVFSALLSILDQGTLCDFEGASVDFRNTVVIFSSDTWNSEVLARLLGHSHPSVSSTGITQEREKMGFRSELLNRVDEIVLFDPFSVEQLSKVGRLSMRAGPHLKKGAPLALSTAIFHLFNTPSDPIYQRIPDAFEHAASFLGKGLFICERNSREKNSSVLQSSFGQFVDWIKSF